MEIAITGSTGLIGTALGAALRADGHRVRPVVRGPSSDPDAVRWDPAAGTIDAAGLDGVDAVVHLAGVGIGDRRWNEGHKAAVRSSRTEGTGLLARTLAGLDRPPAVLVSGSAIGYYGDRGDEVLTELSAPGDDFLAGVVQEWEAAAGPAVDAGIRTVYLRTGIVLAARGGALSRLALPFKLFLGGRLGSGRQWMSWIALDDEVGAIRFAIDTPGVAGPLNAVAPEPVTNAELAKALGAALHRPAAVPVPAFGPRLLLGREMADELVFVSQRVRPQVLTDAGYPFAHTEVRGALGAIYGGGR
jgi:uncharacterized protein (TIGR01777 family)